MMGIMHALFTDEVPDILKGTSLKIYRHMLRNNRSLGLRELQRELSLSSPSVAQYHLSRLERAGLIRKENGNYAISKVLLDRCTKISCFLVPKSFLYCIAATILLVIEVIVFIPDINTVACFFSVGSTLVFFVNLFL